MTHPTEVKLPESLEVVADPFKALREATAAVLTPIGNMTDRQTAVLRTMERRLAYQQACGPYTIDSLLRRLSDAESALKARDAEIERLRGDAERMDWLMQHTVNVRVHLRYGSRNLFWAGPEEGDGEILPSNLRAAIDQARAEGGKEQS